jgi:peptidoglycan/xylan/chitin deacetylase (PgdA/CDA1 family)
MNGKKDGVLMACYACLLVIGGLLTWLKYDYNAVKMEDVREACGYVSASATPVEAPKIALTFDDGPSTAWTPALLDGLKERGVKATFFLIGENADKNPEIVKRMAEEGHLIGNHTYHHVELTKVSENEARLELADTSAVIVRITGKEPEYMRPPFGAWQRKLEQEIQMLPVLWTIDPLDWTTENQDEIVNKVVTEAEENDIILLHDCYKSSVEAGLRIVDILQEEGFVFVTVDELLLN